MVNIKVAVRIRPLNQKEIVQKDEIVIKTVDKSILVTNPKVPDKWDASDSRQKIRRFAVDYCYDPKSSDSYTQEAVFKEIGMEVLDSMFNGYNACVFAYGHSASGKTYTMMGDQDDPGLTPKICKGLFERMKEKSSTCKVAFNTVISFLEIYNERVKDLLVNDETGQSAGNFTLRVREHPKLGPYVQDLTQHTVEDEEKILELLTVGNSRRSTAATENNVHSSRSHAVFTIRFKQCDDDNFETDKSSKVHLVDLAGSERATTAATKTRLKEGANINKSLVTLGNVISALADSSDVAPSKEHSASKTWQPFVPYRDSVLTWLLKDTLGGNSNTIMIATISPGSSCLTETINTLRYAKRTKRIINQPIINEDPKVKTIRELREEVTKLKNMLLSFRITDVKNGRSSKKEAASKSTAGDDREPSSADLNERSEPADNNASKNEENGKIRNLDTLQIIRDGNDNNNAESEKPKSTPRIIIETPRRNSLNSDANEINDEKSADVNGLVIDGPTHESPIFSDSLESFSFLRRKSASDCDLSDSRFSGFNVSFTDSEAVTKRRCENVKAPKISLKKDRKKKLKRKFSSCEDLSCTGIARMLHRSRPDLIKGIATRSQDGLPSTSSQSYTDVSGLSQSTSENSLNSSGSVDSQPSDNKSVRSDRSSATTVQPVGRKQVAKPRSVAGKSSEPPKPPTSRKSSVGDASGSSTPTQVAKPPTKKKDKRSEIVAAVTTRLYATKKKPDPRLEALQAADKDYDDDDGELEELKLCKRARMKLFDLSRKLAMTKRVRKTVDSDTQTEFIAGTIRLKEKCVITDQRGIIRFENSSTNTPIDKGLKDDKEPPVIMNQVFIPRSSNYVVECGKGVRVEVPGSPVKRDLGTQTMAERKTFKHQNTSPIKRIEDDEFSDDSLDLDQEDLEPKIGYLYRNRGVKYRSNDNLYREILYIDKPLFKQVIDNNLYRSFDSLLDKQPYRVEKSTLPISRYPICGTNVLYEYDPNKSIPDKIIYSNLGTQAVEPPCPRKPEVQVTLFNGLPLAICSESSNENVSVSVMSANLLSPNLRTDDNSSSDNSFLSNDGSEITSASETSSEDFVFYENPKEKGARELYTISENSEQSDKISSDNSSVQDTAFDAGAACRLEFTQPFTWERTEDVIYFEEPLLKTSQGDFEGRETSGVAENVAESVKGVEAEEPSREGDEKIPERVKLSEIFQNVMKVNVKNPEIDEGRMKTELPEGAVRFEVPEKLNPEAEETIPGKVKLSEIFQNVKKVDVKASGAKNSGTEEAIIEGIEELELPEGAVKAETAEPEKMKLSDIFQNVKRTDLAPDTKNRKPSEGAMKLELPEGVELYVPENVKEIIESLKKVGIIESFKPEETSELVKKSPGEVPEPVKIPESDQASRAKPKGVPKSLETNPKSVPKIKISQAEASTKPKTPEVVITLGSPEKLRCNVKNFSCKKVNWSEMQPNAQRQYLNFNILNSSRQAPFSIDTHLFGESSKKQNSEAAFPSEDSITFVFMGPSKQNSSVLMEIIKRSLGQATERKSRNRGVQCNSKLMRSVSVDTAMFALSRFARNQTPAGDMNRTTSLDMLASEDVQTILEQGRLHNVKENSCQCDLEETLQQIQKPKCTCKVLKYATGTTTTKDQETETIQERHEITTQTNKLDVMTTSESQTLFDAESVHVPAPPCPETPAAAKPDKRNRWKELKEIILGTECEIDVPEISTSSFRLGCYPEINRYGREDAAEQPLSLDSSSQTRRVRFSEPKRWSLADIAQIVQKKDATQTSMSAFLKEATLLLKNLNEVSKTPPDVQSPKKVQKRAENSVQTEKETNPKSPRRFDLTWPRRRATGKPPAGSKFLRSPVRPHSNPMAFPDVVKSQLESRISSCSTNWNISNLSTSFSNSYVGDVCSRPSSARSDYSNDSYYRYKPVRLPFNVSELEESCKRLEFAIERDRIRHRNLENRMSYFDVPKYVPRSLDLYEKPEPEVKEPISLNESRKTSQKSSNFRSCKCYCHRLTGFNRVKTSCFELESLNGKSKHCHVCCVPCQEEKPKRYYSAPVLNSCDLDCSRCHLCYNYCSCPSVRLKHVRTSPKAYMQHLLTVRRQIVDASKFTNIR